MIRRARTTDLNWMAEKSLPKFNKIFPEPKKLRELKTIIKSCLNSTLVADDCSAFIQWFFQTDKNGKKCLVFFNCFSEIVGNGPKLYRRVLEKTKSDSIAAYIHNNEKKLIQCLLKREGFSQNKLDDTYTLVWKERD